MEILLVSISNSTAVGLDDSVAASFQQRHIHNYVLILKLKNSDNHKLPHHQRSSKSNKESSSREIASLRNIRYGRLLGLKKKRRLQAFKTSMSMPKIDDKAHFELKGQFLKELRDNTFSGSDHEDANEHIDKVLKIVDLFYIPKITQDQIMLRAFPMSLTRAMSRWLRNEPSGLEVPTRQILDSKGVIPTMTAANARVAIQEMVEHSQKWYDGTSTRTRSTETSDGLAAIQAQLNNLGREIKKVNETVYAAQVGCELCKGPHYTKDFPLKEEGKTLEEAYYTQFGVPFQQERQYIAATLGFY
ncbi:hypothetical protein Tco_1230014 [Tanacetum coccineum]